jgi:hypothetical protein
MDILGPFIKANKMSIQTQPLWPNAAVTAGFYNGFVGILTGQKTAEQALADMDSAFNKGIGGGR